MKHCLASLVLILLVSCANVRAAGETHIDVGHFSRGTPGEELPPGWKPYRLGKALKETRYRLVKLEDRTVLEARAEQSVAAIAYELKADTSRTPWLSFSWRTERLLEQADMRTKAGDDYPARVYVIFDYDVGRLPFAERMKLRMARAIWGEQVPAAALCYVWEPRQPVGHAGWSAYTSRLHMIVAESGTARLGHWVTIERNVADDFRAAFGEDAPPISAIVVAADTDNTLSNALTWFGDISLNAAPGLR